jgi:membrane-associated protease RseP (regulator of RpoE activity)
MLIGFLSVAAAVSLLLVLIVVHEAGHFFAARFFGMQTPVVGLGLPFVGPTWRLGTFKNIEFRLHPLLLGAYVAIPEMDDETANSDDIDIQLKEPKRSFPAWQRMIVSFAGPGANFLFALLLALVTVLFLGVPKDSDTKDFFVAQVSSSASDLVKQKIRSGDQILGLDGSLVEDQFDFIKKLQQKPNQIVSVMIQRDVNKVSSCLVEALETNSSGKLNISLTKKIEYQPVSGIPIFSHLQWAWKYFSDWLMWCVSGLWYLLSAPFRKDGMAPKVTEVHGVFLAVNMISKFIQENASSVLQWGALFSIELGIFNLLPILPLDGGHILFQSLEMVVKPEKLKKTRDYVAQAGLTLILLLSCLIIFNDLRDIIFPAKL